MSIHQLQLPICHCCGKLHTRFLEYSYSALCQPCHDKWIVDTFSTSAIALKMTDSQAIDYLHQRRPELFERGVLPDYWFALKNVHQMHGKRS